MLNLIKSRRSTRKYQDKMIRDEDLAMILEAGIYAPSGGNSQSNHFIVIRNKSVLEGLNRLVVDCFKKMDVTEGMYKSKVNSIVKSKAGNYVFYYNAPVLVVVCNKIDYSNNMADSCIAIENMMLMANGLDLGSCFINQLTWLREDPKINLVLKQLGMEEDETVFGAVALGYADTPDGLPVRVPLSRTGNKVTFIE
ncbi:MAG: nitroreductase [Erysipelotrichaceae bacterium]|nr:nitroreductase [Erysipelotrichaceae bacterium]